MNSRNVKQHDANDCGPACLVSVARHFGLRVPIARIRQMAGTDGLGTSLLGLVAAAEKIGLSAKGVKSSREYFSKLPLPVIAHVSLQTTHSFHYVVLYGIGKKKVRMMDPAHGRMQRCSLKEFQSRWTGVAVLLAPKPDYTPLLEVQTTLQRFWSLVNPHKKVFLQILFGAIVYTILGLGISIYVQKIVDHVLINSNRNLLNLLSLLMAGVILLQAYIGLKRRIFVLKTGQLIDARLILGYYRHLLRLPQRFFDTMQVGEIISRINDAVKIRAFINNTAIDMLVNLLIVIFAFMLMFTYSWRLALLVVLIIPVYLAIYLLLNRVNKKVERRLMEDSASLESQLVESITHIRTVKAFGMESTTAGKTENRFIALLFTFYRSSMNDILATDATRFLASFFLVLLLWAGSGYVLEGEITAGELLSFYALTGYFSQPLLALIGANKTIQNALIAADRLFEIMDLEREHRQSQILLSNEDFGDICFENIGFRYGSRAELFKNFNVSIRQGKITAVVGESGSGKSTLVSLLMQLYPLSEGRIKIGAIDLSLADKLSIRRSIGVVPQHAELFNASILDNIVLGETPDISRIMTLFEELGIDEFVSHMPDGYNTEIGENGAALSGGQKQRIAIARALYRSPGILILDEATTGLDAKAEKMVQRVVHRFASGGGTVILISHQLKNTILADQILVLKQGKLVEKGNHQALLKKKGVYYDLWKNQKVIN
jgi:ATP-binding cassette subfamily B protein